MQESVEDAIAAESRISSLLFGESQARKLKL